jgi:hypothetical protein
MFFTNSRSPPRKGSISWAFSSRRRGGRAVTVTLCEAWFHAESKARLGGYTLAVDFQRWLDAAGVEPPAITPASAPTTPAQQSINNRGASTRWVVRKTGHSRDGVGGHLHGYITTQITVAAQLRSAAPHGLPRCWVGWDLSELQSNTSQVSSFLARSIAVHCWYSD